MGKSRQKKEKYMGNVRREKKFTEGIKQKCCRAKTL